MKSTLIARFVLALVLSLLAAAGASSRPWPPRPGTFRRARRESLPKSSSSASR